MVLTRVGPHRGRGTSDGLTALVLAGQLVLVAVSTLATDEQGHGGIRLRNGLRLLPLRGPGPWSPS